MYGQYYPKMNYKVCYSQYCVDFDSVAHIPKLVYYKIIEDSLGSYGRYDFGEDPNVSGDVDPSEYSYSGYDRGHLFPAASSNSYESASESFYMTNMAPQLPEFNRGVWKSLESWERSVSDSVLYVIDGCIYDCKSDKINDKIVIPDKFFKVLYNPKWNLMIGFLIPQTGFQGSFTNYVVTVDYIEELLGINLFYQLPDDIEKELESDSDYWDWT